MEKSVVILGTHIGSELITIANDPPSVAYHEGHGPSLRRERRRGRSREVSKFLSKPPTQQPDERWLEDDHGQPHTHAGRFVIAPAGMHRKSLSQ